MRRGWAIAAGLLITSTAHADDTSLPGAAGPQTDAELAQSYVLIAHDAAATGSCDLVWDLGEQVQALDPALHARAFVTDPQIAACLRGQARPPAPPARGLPRVEPTTNDGAPPAGPSSVRPQAQPAGAGSVERTGTPPLSASRLLGEVLMGGLAVTGGAILGANIGEGLCDGDWCPLNLVTGAYVGATLAVPLAVYAVGVAGDQDGSLLATVAGSLLGHVPGLVTGAVVQDISDPEFLALAVIGPPLGALIGFNLSRRWARAGGTALLSVHGGDLALGLPLVTRGSSATGAPVTTLTLAGGTF